MFLHNSTILCYRGVYSSQITMSAKIPEYVSAMLTWGMNGTNWHGRLDSTICCSLQLQAWVTVTWLWWAGSPLSQKKSQVGPRPRFIKPRLLKLWVTTLGLNAGVMKIRTVWIWGASDSNPPPQTVLDLPQQTWFWAHSTCPLCCICGMSAAYSPQLRSKATDCYELPCV